MKAKLLIITTIFLMSGVWSFGQPLRPPVKTNELELIDKFTWQNDVIGKDSLVYFIQIDQNCYKYRSLETASVWDTICFSSKATVNIIINGDTIILIDGGTFDRNDSTFQLRKDPFCSICWEYKYSTWIDWQLLFCETTPIGRFVIGKDIAHLFRMEYGTNGLNWIDSLHGKFNKNDTIKVLTEKDSTWSWQPLPDQIDSVVINGVKYALEDSITININDPDSDPTNELDSVFFTPDSTWIGGVNDTVNTYWERSGYGAGISYYGNYGSIGLGVMASSLYGLRIEHNLGGTGYFAGIRVEVDGSGYGIHSLSQNSNAIWAESIDGIGIRAKSTSDYSGKFSGGLGLKADSLSLNSGSKIGRLGTIAPFDIWTGTQAQYDAIGSPSSTTLYFIKD